MWHFSWHYLSFCFSCLEWALPLGSELRGPPSRLEGHPSEPMEHPWPPPVGEGRDLPNRQGTPFCQQSGQHANASAIWLAPWLQPWETLNREPRDAVPMSPGAALWEVGVLSYRAKVIPYTAAENGYIVTGEDGSSILYSCWGPVKFN